MNRRAREEVRMMENETTMIDEIRGRLARTAKGTLKQSIDNYLLVLREDPALKWAVCRNEMTGRNEIVKPIGTRKQTGRAYDSDDRCQICVYLESVYGLKSEKQVDKAVDFVAMEHAFHPVRDFLRKLKWDGMSRIADLLPKYLGAEKCEYTTEVTRVLLTAMIRRIYEPGCKFDNMVVLVGGQGVGKSTLARFLACRDEWYTDDIRRLDDDSIYQKMAGHWVIEMSEMIATVNAKSIEEIKSFLSRQKETYRLPYDRNARDWPRQCVFIETTNNEEFLPLDRSGNRRFLPVQCDVGKVDRHILENEAEARAYVLQTLAEAVVLYGKNKSLELSDNVKKQFPEIQRQFMAEDTAAGLIAAWLDQCSQQYVCTMQIYNEALHMEGKPKRYESSEINQIIQTQISGWKQSKDSTRNFEGYGKQRYWYRVPQAPEEGFRAPAEGEHIPFA